MTAAPCDTEQLIQRALRGEQAAFAELYAAFAPGVQRLCSGLLNDRLDAEDVTQETFVYAFRNLFRYDPLRSAFRTWLFTIAISRCRNVYRRGQRRAAPTLLTSDLPAPSADGPEAQQADRAARGAIVTALAALSPRLREAVILRYGHGLTFREMAAVLDCPQKTAESRIRLAHEQLRRLLQAQSTLLLDELLAIEL